MTHLIIALLAAAPDTTDPTPQEDVFSSYTAPHHLELAIGFTGGVRDETGAPYAFSSGTAENIPYAQALATPFALAPYDRTIVYGLALEWRYVTRHVRFTGGLQKPFASFRLMDAIFPSDVNGTTRQIGTRDLDLWDVRVGLGAEYAFRYVTPFVDVIGDVQSVNASLTVDGLTAEYKAWTFGFVVRAGLKVQMGEGVFLAPMGEYGLGGPVRWAVGLQAGWVLAAG